MIFCYCPLPLAEIPGASGLCLIRNHIWKRVSICNQSWNFQIFPEVQNYPSQELEVQLLQVEVKFSGAPTIQHLGYKNLDRTFTPTFQDESQLHIFWVANCDAIGENSRTVCNHIIIIIIHVLRSMVLFSKF